MSVMVMLRRQIDNAFNGADTEPLAWVVPNKDIAVTDSPEGIIVDIAGNRYSHRYGRIDVKAKIGRTGRVSFGDFKVWEHNNGDDSEPTLEVRNYDNGVGFYTSMDLRF